MRIKINLILKTEFPPLFTHNTSLRSLQENAPKGWEVTLNKSSSFSIKNKKNNIFKCRLCYDLFVLEIYF